MADKRSSWSKAPALVEEASDKAKEALSSASERASELGAKVKANVLPVAGAAVEGVRAGLGRMGTALEVGEAGTMPAELLSQADLPELTQADALSSLAARLDREADFWRAVGMRQLARAAWTERLGVGGSIALLVGGVVLAAIAAFRALFATGGGTATALLLGVGIGVLLVAAIAVGQLASRQRRGQLDAVKEALSRADLAEMRLHRIALLMELRALGRDGYVAALSELEADVRSA